MTDDTLDTPWTLHFDRDGTEDRGFICDANGHVLVTSRPFWLPEDDDPVPATLASLWAMTAAPQLVGVLREGLDLLAEAHRLSSTCSFSDLTTRLGSHLGRVRGALVEADRGPADPSAAAPIVIEVGDGAVREVRNVPPGTRYVIVYDDDRL